MGGFPRGKEREERAWTEGEAVVEWGEADAGEEVELVKRERTRQEAWVGERVVEGCEMGRDGAGSAMEVGGAAIVCTLPPCTGADAGGGEYWMALCGHGKGMRCGSMRRLSVLW